MKHDTKLYPLFLILLLLTITFTGNLYSQTWNALGSGTNGVIYASLVFNGELIVAGKFSSPASNIARWNGTTWSPLGTGTDDTVFALTIYNNQLVAVGSFINAGGVACNRIARWSGTTSWTSFGLGANNTVLSVLFAGTYLRAGGRFTAIGGVNCSKIARFDGTNWSAMGTGVNNDVYCMAVFGSDLVLGGTFTMAGSVTANRIVRFNLSSGAYTAVGTGVDNNSVLALGVFNNNLYVGGNFTAIGGITVNYIARWSGTNWNPIGTGTSGPVKSMYTNGTTSILIGGSFVTASGITVNNIANYNGTAFSTLGNGITGGTPSVNSITYWLNILIASGLFTTAGAAPVPAANAAGYGLLPIAPTLISPPDAATGQSITPLLTWSLISGASNYGVNVARDPNFTIVVFNVTNLVSPQFLVPSGTPLLNNTTYFWRANARNGLGTGPWSLVRFFTTAMVGIINNHEIPLTFNLYQNYPNPFNPVTKIRFDLPDIENVSALKLTIYDIKGEKVTDLLNTEYIAGKWEVDFDASNLASGIYFYSIETGPYVQTNKMILIK